MSPTQGCLGSVSTGRTQGTGRDCFIQDSLVWESTGPGGDANPPAPHRSQWATGGLGDGEALLPGKIQAGLSGDRKRQDRCLPLLGFIGDSSSRLVKLSHAQRSCKVLEYLQWQVMLIAWA